MYKNNTVPDPVDDVCDQLAQISIKKKRKNKQVIKKKEDEPRREFGKFRCTICKKHWRSANSWAGYWQECNTCLIEIHPYELRPLKNSKTGAKKPHPEELCEMCLELGSTCVNRS